MDARVAARHQRDPRVPSAFNGFPRALELCPRAVVLDTGQVVADGPTREVLADEVFMRAHRLELPAGFNPLVS